MNRLLRDLVPFAVQVALVSTVLVVGLVPLTAPLPPMSPAQTVFAGVAALVLALSTAALGATFLVPRWFRYRTLSRTMAAALIGGAAALVLFTATDGLITRPLLVVTGLALLAVAARTGWTARRR